jgi:hypothetical protein
MLLLLTQLSSRSKRRLFAGEPWFDVRNKEQEKYMFCMHKAPSRI